MSETETATPLLVEVARYAETKGVKAINQLAGAWVETVDEDWTFAMNGHKEPVAVEPVGCMAVPDLPPYTCVVWWNGWLAGLIDPGGGVLAAHPEGANEQTFRDALARAARAGGEGK